MRADRAIAGASLRSYSIKGVNNSISIPEKKKTELLGRVEKDEGMYSVLFLSNQAVLKP